MTAAGRDDTDAGGDDELTSVDENDEIIRLAEEPAGGIDGPEGFQTDEPAPAP